MAAGRDRLVSQRVHIFVILLQSTRFNITSQIHKSSQVEPCRIQNIGHVVERRTCLCFIQYQCIHQRSWRPLLSFSLVVSDLYIVFVQIVCYIQKYPSISPTNFQNSVELIDNSADNRESGLKYCLKSLSYYSMMFTWIIITHSVLLMQNQNIRILQMKKNTTVHSLYSLYTDNEAFSESMT